jgi:hypothetical protein
MPVRADDRCITVSADTGNELVEFGDDGTPDTVISDSEGYNVRAPRQIPYQVDSTWVVSSENKSPP